jgi:hypothetical protein
MGLTDSWTATSTTTATVRTITVPRAVAVGDLLALSVTLGGGSTSINITDPRGNVYDETVHTVHSGSTFNSTIVLCRLATALEAGDELTITSSSSTNRCAVVAGVFDDVIGPIDKVSLASTSTNQNVSTGPTATLTADRALVLYAVAGAGSVSPVTAGSGMTLVGSLLTSAGSSERSAALLYKYSTSSTHSASAVLANAVVSTSLIAALAAEAPLGDPEPELEFTADWFDGTEVLSVTGLAWWDGTTLTPVTSLDVT